MRTRSVSLMTKSTAAPEDAYKQPLRDFMATKGKPVRKERNPYDWSDYRADGHTGAQYGTCHWVVAPGALLTEASFVEWGGTFGTDTTEMAVEVTPATCACGQYRDYTLRFVGTFGEVLRGALGDNDQAGIRL